MITLELTLDESIELVVGITKQKEAAQSWIRTIELGNADEAEIQIQSGMTLREFEKMMRSSLVSCASILSKIYVSSL